MASRYEETLEALRRGGVVVYPTETLYALGCDALDEAACHRISMLKGRAESKPLPLVLGHIEQLAGISLDVPVDVWRLTEIFWPGPLSILVPGVEALASQTMDSRGMVSVRVTPDVLAASLSVDLSAPLVATSANPSGAAPAAVPGDLDEGLLGSVDAVLTDRPWPLGGPPSTLIEPLGNGKIKIHREGAVPVRELIKAGLVIS